MDQLWTWLKQADAKTLFLASIGLFVIVLIWVGWQQFGCTSAVQTSPALPPHTARLQEGVATNYTGELTAFLSNQLSADALTVPLNPFRPDINDLPTHSTTNTTPKRHRYTMAMSAPAETKEEAPVIPCLTYHGYFQRPDGANAALFGDSVTKASRFLTAGETIRGVTLLSADIRTANIKLPSGETTNLSLGASVTLQ